MTNPQKTALSRIICDIIKADEVIDVSEIDFYLRMQARYTLDQNNLLEAQKIDFGSAINTLRQLPKNELESLVRDMRELTVVDGDCAAEEAFLIIALNLCLDPKYNSYCKLITTSVKDITIGKGNIVYTETEYDVETNDEIKEHLRYIALDFNAVGLNFIYIPQIAEDFRCMKEAHMDKIVKFLAPTLDVNKQEYIINTLRNINTEYFSKDFLVKKLGLDEIFDSEPAILFQVCESCDKVIYMHITLGSDILAELTAFVDMYKELTLSHTTPVWQKKHGNGLLYYGFHKAMFNLLAYPGAKKESRIIFNTNKKRVAFVDLGVELQLSKKRKAIYMLIIHQSICGNGINLRPSENQKKKYCRIFSKIYGCMGENEDSDFTIGLSQNLSHIRKAIKEIDLLDNINTYLPERTTDEVLRVKINPDKVFVEEADKQIPIKQSSWANFR